MGRVTVSEAKARVREQLDEGEGGMCWRAGDWR